MTDRHELEGNGQKGEERPFLRKDVEHILSSDERLPLLLRHETLPIAGLRSFVHHTEGAGKLTVHPTEILNPEYRPVVIIDLDDTCWPHAIDLVHAVSHVSGVPATDNDLWTYGHTRNIPQWKNPVVGEIQNMIQKGQHPDVFPFVNKAHNGAVQGVHALERMGYSFAYLTARASELFHVTKRVMAWNNIPHNERAELTDARLHSEPHTGFLYCTCAGADDVNAYKNETVNLWLTNLRQAGWKGTMIIVDDTPKAFKKEIENGDIVGIALDGPLNHNLPPFHNEIRVNSWSVISEFLSHYHGLALRQDPSSVRTFDCGPELPGVRLEVNKGDAGIGYFKLERLPRGSYRFLAPSPAEATL